MVGIAGRASFLIAATAAAAVSLALAGAACDRGAPAGGGGGGSSASPAATTGPAVAASTSPATHAASQPGASILNINGHNTIFPAARLRLEQEGDHLVGLLFTDDPREALRDNYTGNSFYLRLELNVADPADLPQAIWDYKAPSSARRGEEIDSPHGVFLTGRKLQLTPFDAKARFVKQADGATTCWITGQFKVVDAATDPRGPGQMLVVSGQLPVRVENRVAEAD